MIGAWWLLLLFATLLVPRDLLHQCADDHHSGTGQPSETGSVHGSCAICHLLAPVLGPYVEALANGPLLSTPLELSVILRFRPVADLEALSGRGPPPLV